MRGLRLKKAVFMLLGAFLLDRVAGWAQTDAEINGGIQFNFSTPGARSLGLGGAFLGLADDATAAYTNPAGLTVLSKPEVSIEGRRWSYANRFVQAGRFTGTPTGRGIDTVSGLQFGTAEDETSGISFLSFVYPSKSWAVAVYRHELANFQTAFTTQGPFFDLNGEFKRVFPLETNMDLKIVNLGVSGSYRVTEDFSIGLGVSSYDLDMGSTTTRYNFTDTERVNLSTASIDSIQRQTGDDRDVAVNLGFRWSINSRWGIGGVYRQGPDLEFRATNANPAGPIADQTIEFNVPDVYGLGVSFHPVDAVTIALDYDRIRYSSLTANTVNIFVNPANMSPEADRARAAARNLTIDDANEIHLGFEYIFTKMAYPLALRLGSWLDPDHRIRYEGAVVNEPEHRHAARFRPGDDEIHYSVGLGMVFGTFQVDAAADFSDPIDTASLSGVFRF
jgi:long-chain fatty acid transport protein